MGRWGLELRREARPGESNGKVKGSGSAGLSAEPRERVRPPEEGMHGTKGGESSGVSSKTGEGRLEEKQPQRGGWAGSAGKLGFSDAWIYMQTIT